LDIKGAISRLTLHVSRYIYKIETD